MNSITPSYDPLLILLSVGVAFIGSYITISLCEQLRLKKLPVPPSTVVLGEKGLVAAMALSLGGIAVWSMHLCGMSSMKLTAPDGSNVPIHYNTWRTVVSFVAVFISSLIGLYVGSFDKMFGKTKQEIVEIYVNHASKMSMSEVRKISPTKMIWIISTHSLGHLVGGGLIVGSGVSVMHYLGMWGLEFDLGVILWNKGIVAASLLIAVLVSVTAFWILFRLLSLYCDWESLRVLSAAVMTVAVCGTHYTGMMAAEFRYESSRHISTAHTNGEAVTLDEVKNVAFVLSFALLMLVLTEVRAQYHKLYVNWKKLESATGGSVSGLMSRSGNRSITNSIARHSTSPTKVATWRDRISRSFQRDRVQPVKDIEDGKESQAESSHVINGKIISSHVVSGIQNICV